MVLFADKDASAFRALQQSELERVGQLPPEEARSEFRRLALLEARWLAERKSAAQQRMTVGLAPAADRVESGM